MTNSLPWFPHLNCVMRWRSATFLLILLFTSVTALLAQKSRELPKLNSSDSCDSLKGMKVPAAAIGLPTSGAYVRSARLVHDSRGEYCKVLGGIRPVDSSAQDIRFEVNLPTNWNRKAVQVGGGAFDGWLGGATSGLKRGPLSVASEPGPLARGFATFGGDSGHHKHYLFLPDAVNVVNASFATNPEERRNFAQDGLKKTHDAAVIVMERRYGMRPSRMFFLGGSTGGREAFFVVQRWPEDYDGVLGAFAGWDQTELDLQYIRVSQAMYAKGGFLPKSKTRLLARSVMEACDELDGLRDRMIANVSACHFDPATLLCVSGKHKDCLTPQELETVRTFATEQRTAQKLWNGVQTMPGFNVLAGADLTGSMGLLHHAEHPPKIFLNSFYYLIGDQVLRFFLTGDKHFNALTFDTTTGGKYSAELLPQSQASDASDADLTRFAQHGGKFFIVHGTADATIPTDSSVMYYKMLQNRMTKEQMDGFLRFYLIPGFGHGKGVFKAGFDALGVLDRWLDTGIPPQDLVLVDNNKGSGRRTRPLCVYPAWPKYKGSGDVNDAMSFVCATETAHVDSIVR